MNSIIMLYWYHFDLNNNIINLKLKNKKNLKKKEKHKIYSRIINDYKLKIKKD